MDAFTIEEIPEEVLRYAQEHIHQINVTDLDKRVKALTTVFEAPRTDLQYARKLALKLYDKCVTAGRGDLANEIQRIMFDPVYTERRKTNADAIKAAKLRYQQYVEKE